LRGAGECADGVTLEIVVQGANPEYGVLSSIRSKKEQSVSLMSHKYGEQQAKPEQFVP
jgi:hypothetical protein